MIVEGYYEQLHELVAELLAAGPLPLAVVIERLDAQGALEELRDDGVPDDALGEALLDEALLTESVWITATETVALHSQLKEGLVLTHRLTAEELTRGEVAICPDLVVLDDGIGGPLELVSGGVLVYRPSLVPVPGEDHSTYAGHDGWLAGLAVGDLVAFTRGGRTVSVARVDELDGDEREVQLLREAIDGRLGSGAGEEAYPLVFDALTADLDAFRRPVRPLSELLEAAGLERRGFSFGRAGETWPSFAEASGDRRRTDAARRYGFDACCTAALDLVSVAFAAFDTEGEVDPSVLTSLAHGAVAPAFAEVLLDSQADHLVAFTDELMTVASGRDVAPALLLRATALEWQGEVLAAEAVLREALQGDPDYGPPALELAGYEIDRGHLDQALTLLHHPDLRPAADTLETLEELRAEQEAPYRHAGRNDPCPCGSGRKFKVCCQRQRTVPLAVRTKVLNYKLRRYLSRDDWHSTVVGVASSACDPDDPDLPMSMVSMARHPLIADFVTFEGSAAEEYLERRGALLPDDERELLAQLLEEPRRLWEVTGIERGSGIALRDTATGETLEVVERLASQRAEVGHLVLARIVRLGDRNQMMGIPLDVAWALRDSALELLDTHPGADELATWYGQTLA